jgi:hypothetical protein
MQTLLTHCYDQSIIIRRCFAWLVIDHRTIYMLPLGQFRDGYSPSLELLRECTSAYFLLPCRTLPVWELNDTTSLTTNPSNSKVLLTPTIASNGNSESKKAIAVTSRVNGGVRQLLTSDIRENVLIPNLPTSVCSPPIIVDISIF